MTTAHDLGRAGEAAAAAWYEQRGGVVLDRNWRCPAGEIDLVVSIDETIVICEVKTRSSNRFGTAYEAVGRDKQRRLRRLVGEWLGAHEVPAHSVRIDVAAVTPEGRGFRVDVVEHAC